MCSGSEAGSYLRLIDFVYHSNLGLRVIKTQYSAYPPPGVSAHTRFWGLGLGLRVEGSSLDFCITQLKAQGPSRPCNESKEEEEEGSSLIGCTSCVVKSFRSRSSFISSPLWTP